MHQHVVGEDPQWVLYRHRERLDLTDPPVAPPRPDHIGVRRGVPAVMSALAILALLAADTARPAPTNLGAHGATDTQTPTVPGHPTTAAHRVTGPVHRHPAVPHHNPQKGLR